MDFRGAAISSNAGLLACRELDLTLTLTDSADYFLEESRTGKNIRRKPSYPVLGIVNFCNGRGTAEQWIKEGKYALNWTRLSCHKFVANQVRLSLFIPSVSSRQAWPTTWAIS
tara:strand:- start:39 stop:377 length:339 start_codon:yes stop_codon:yes gene_type:complete